MFSKLAILDNDTQNCPWFTFQRWARSGTAHLSWISTPDICLNLHDKCSSYWKLYSSFLYRTIGISDGKLRDKKKETLSFIFSLILSYVMVDLNLLWYLINSVGQLFWHVSFDKYILEIPGKYSVAFVLILFTSLFLAARIARFFSKSSFY